MRPILLLALSLVLTAGCSTDAPKYRVGSTGAPQSREQAQQTHIKGVESTNTAGQLDTPLKLISAPFPEYPSSLRNDGLDGRVRIRFIVESNGTVSNPVVLGAPPPALAAITLRSIMQWRFEPPLRGGKPGRVAVEQEFVFALE
jgi:TonB family protein